MLDSYILMFFETLSFLKMLIMYSRKEEFSDSHL